MIFFHCKINLQMNKNDISFWINIPRKIGKQILFLSNFIPKSHFDLMCLGYSDDYTDFTGLDWIEDSNLDFSDKKYSEFRLYLRIL